jgi:hypothetical protein
LNRPRPAAAKENVDGAVQSESAERPLASDLSDEEVADETNVRSKHHGRPSAASDLLEALHLIVFHGNRGYSKFIHFRGWRFPVRRG